MKKLVLVVLTVLTALFASVCAVACTVSIQKADPKVVSVAVDGVTETTYVACDALNLTDVTLIATYDDKHVESGIPVTREMLDPDSYDMDTPGDYRVRVEYGGVSTSFAITVVPWEKTKVELAGLPYVLNYVVGQEVDPNGATVKLSFEGNKTKVFSVPKDWIQPYDRYTVGKKFITISCYGEEMQFEVEYVDKTPIGIKIVDSADNNFVFEGFGDSEYYDKTGMTVRISYDNDETPKYDAVDLDDQLIVSIDDSVTMGREGDQVVDAVLLYDPDGYEDTYTYRFFGTPRVGIGDVVTPQEKLASNSVTRTLTRQATRMVTKNGKQTEEFYVETYEETIALDPIMSKSYGTVVDIGVNDDGSRSLTVSTLVTYDVTNLEKHFAGQPLKVGDIVKDDAEIGTFGTRSVKTVGGGVVVEIENNKVVVRTLPTYVFRSKVCKKSCSGVEVTVIPSPTIYKDTDVNGMVEGDVLDKTTGYVRVSYNDGTNEVFRMDDGMISLVNSGAASVNDAFVLSPGRQKVLVVYAGVLEENVKTQYYDTFYVTVEKKYPVELAVDIDTISGRTFYMGDTISLSSMTYHIRYNNEQDGEEAGESLQMTLDMVDDGYSLYCGEVKDGATIRFKLPKAYAALIPTKEDGEEGEYIKPVCTYNVRHQPISAIEFTKKPVKVYVDEFGKVDYDGAVLDVYYRNNTRKSIVFGEAEVQSYTVVADAQTWDDVLSYNFDKGTTDVLYFFTKEGDTTAGTAMEIIRGTYKGYQAKVVYFDENGVMSGTEATFPYYLVAGQTVSAIKVSALRGADGEELCKRAYTQYEDWDFSGLQMTVTYSGDGSQEIVDVLPEMVYDSSTNVLGEDIPVKFSYLGATDDNSFKISVGDRLPEKITLLSRGASVYPSALSVSVNFAAYAFRLSYNAGPSEQISGNMLSEIGTREKSVGFWYSVYDSLGETPTSLLVPGTYVFVLHYSYLDTNNPKGYSYISTMSKEQVLAGVASGDAEAELYTFEVVERINEYFIKSVEYEQNILGEDGRVFNRTFAGAGETERRLNEETSVLAVFPTGGSTRVLAEVASGWEIMLSEYYDEAIYDKLLTLHCYDSSTATSYNEYVRITPEMLDYDVSDGTLGYRKVTITYKGFTTKVFVYVWNAELTDVNVEVIPLTNYVYTQIQSEADLDLDGGIVKLTFTKRTRQGVFAGYMNKYVNMSSEDIKYEGFINGLYSKEGEKITIFATYKNFDSDDMKTNYVITVYDRQDLTFGYSNIIFFYGNAAPAAAEPKQFIPEFTLPADVSLRYAESKNMITIAQYLALPSSEQKNYVPVTTYDDNGEMVLSAFINATDGSIVQNNYIDPAAGRYYVKYGRVSRISEEDYEVFTEAQRAHLTAIPTYDPYGRLTETFYSTTIEGLGSERAQSKTRWYDGVIVDKITEEEYLADPTAYVGYEAVDNEYYILMMVVDDRDERVTDKANKFNLRYYETTNYAFQRYTVIQKVVEVKVENGDATAKALRVSMRMTANGAVSNANPYAVFYLHNPEYAVLSDIKDAVKVQYGADYINSVYLASPNEDSFEIIVKFMDTYTVDTEASKDVIAEIYYRALKSLTTPEFKQAIEMGTGVVLDSSAQLDINFARTRAGSTYDTTYDFSASTGNTDSMKYLIKSQWTNGVNVWRNHIESGVPVNDRDALLDEIAGGTTGYRVSYTMTFGDTKTRNRVLQLLSGQIVFTSRYDPDEDKTVYELESGTLGHSSYTVDMSKVTVSVDADQVKINN